jgi:hypothetical protein
MQNSVFVGLSGLGLIFSSLTIFSVATQAAEMIDLQGIQQGNRCTVVEQNGDQTPLLSISNINQIPQTCSQIASSLEAEMNKGNLDNLILIADTIGRDWKICMVRSSQSRCKTSNVLLDFPMGAESDPQQFLSSIIAVNTVIELNGFEGQQTPRKPYSKFGDALKKSNL